MAVWPPTVAPEVDAVIHVQKLVGVSVCQCFVPLQIHRHVKRLLHAGVRLEDEARKAPAEQPFAEKRFVVTGRLENYSRSQIEGKIKELGGAVSGSVSKRTHYLVAGADAGSKLADAERLEVSVLSEEAFLAMIGEA